MYTLLKLPFCVYLFLIFGYKSAQGCMCAPDHPQNTFCYSGYAAKIFIKSIRTVVINDDGNTMEVTIPQGGSIYEFLDPSKSTWTEYRIRILRVFKGELKEDTNTFMYTPAFGFLCKHELQERHTYFLMGNLFEGRLQINLCNYVMDVTDEKFDVVRQLTRNFQLRYPKTCGHCRICHHPMCYDQDKMENACKWPRRVSLHNTLEASKYSCVPKQGNQCSLRYPFERKLDNGETTIIPSEVPEEVTTTSALTPEAPPPLLPELYYDYDDDEIMPEP